MAEKLIKSKTRVKKNGEVFTPERVVKEMCDLLVREDFDAFSNPFSTFLEPSSGNGQFLVEIIRRKMEAVLKNYNQSQQDFEAAMLKATGSMYGVELMQDNIDESIQRVYKIITEIYENEYSETYCEDVELCLLSILKLNIVCGNLLTRLDSKGEIIRLHKWNVENGIVTRAEHSFDKEYDGKDNDEPLGVYHHWTLYNK